MPRKHRLDLSALSSLIVLEQRRAAAEYEDLGRFHAPSECYGDVSSDQEARLTRIFRYAGWTRKQFNDELQARCSARWANRHNLFVNEEPHRDGCSRRTRRYRLRLNRDYTHESYLRRLAAYLRSSGRTPADAWA